MRTRFLWSLGAVALAAVAMAATAGPASSGGTVAGTVTFTGTPPKMKAIDMAKEPTCASQHETPAMTETVVTGPSWRR